MSNIPLGQIITTEEQRDAIHIAIAPVKAARILKPGQHIGFCPNSKEEVSNYSDNLIGNVYPILLDNSKRLFEDE